MPGPEIRRLRCLVTTGSVAHLGHLALEQRVHQRRFADAGECHDHHATQLAAIVAARAGPSAGTRATSAGLLPRSPPPHAGSRRLCDHPTDRVGEAGFVEHPRQGRGFLPALAIIGLLLASGRRAVTTSDDPSVAVIRPAALRAGGHVSGEPLGWA